MNKNLENMTMAEIMELAKQALENESNKKAEFGELTFEGQTGIPTLEIKTGNQIGYLTPFRGYCFQVSGSKDGVGDYGSSGNIHFKNITAPNDEKFAIIKAAAVDAIADHLRKSYVKDNYQMPVYMNAYDGGLFSMFIKASYRWIYGCDYGIR